jgi:uncharacterized membrane protein YhaH (DUF805 family)
MPGLAVSVRRLHDLGKSGLFLLVALIPFIGTIWILVLFCSEGETGSNKFGPDPNEGVSGELGQATLHT